MATLAPSLVRFRTEINTAFPKRDKTSDGWLGDAAHASRPSDHNPDPNSTPPDLVHAIDVDVDDNDPNRDLRATIVLRAIAHPSTNYVISNGVIYSRAYGFKPRTYTGTNGHYHHVHVSILHTHAAENSTVPWGVSKRRYVLLKYGSHGSLVTRYTNALRAHHYPTTDTDTVQSPTVHATERMQIKHHWPMTGVAGYREQREVGL